MSLEAEISGLRLAMERVAVVLEADPAAAGKVKAAAGAAAAAPAPNGSAAPAVAEEAGTPAAPRRGRPPGKAAKFTVEQVREAAFKVRDSLGMEAAKKLIQAHGAAELAKLDPGRFGDFISACEATVAEAAGGEDPDAGDEL